MPVVLRIDGFQFLFYGNEGDPREPAHIHVRQGRDEAKFWLSPEVRLAYNRGLDAHVINRLHRLVEDHRSELEEHGMNSSPDPMSISPEPRAVRFDDDMMWVDLANGRTIGVPLAWFPRLFHATPAQRMDLFLSRSGIHWEVIDEDISIAGIIAGRGDMTRGSRQAAE